MQDAAPPSPLADLGTDLASKRTGMAFQRTRLSADRTLMAVIRTSLSLISFGFTIYKVIQGMQEAQTVDIKDHAARNFGVTLCSIGVLALAAGIIYHSMFMYELRKERSSMSRAGTLETPDGFPASFTLILALVLLLVGIFAIVSMVFRVGPFI